MRFATTTETTPEAIHTARGGYDVFFEDGDGAVLLASAQPLLPWVDGTAAPAAGTLPSLEYGVAAELALIAASFDGDVLKAMLICEYVPLADSLTRLWAEVRKGMRPEDWAPCSKGTFRARLRRAAMSPAVDASQLVIRAADLFKVPQLTNPPAWFITLA